MSLTDHLDLQIPLRLRVTFWFHDHPAGVAVLQAMGFWVVLAS